MIQRELDIKDLKLQYEEVKTVKYATLEEILQMIDNGEFIPYHKSLIEGMFAMKNQMSAHMKEENN